MSLTIRHRWCISRIVECYKEQGVDDEKVQGFIRKGAVLAKFNTLFSGEGANALFVHYAPDSDVEVSLDSFNEISLYHA